MPGRTVRTHGLGRWVFCALLLVLSTAGGRALAQGDSAGTLEVLLKQLGELQQSGALDRFESTVVSPLDRSREQGQDIAEKLGAVSPDVRQALEKLRSKGGGLSETERLLAKRYCRGQLTRDQLESIELIDSFSRVERDYCLRTGELLLQHGYEVFADFAAGEALGAGAIPEDYVLGIGDELVITFQGPESRSLNVRVDREGRVVLPNWPPVAAAGRTFGDFRRELEARTAATRIGTEVFVSVGQVRALQVVVAGEVRQPGVYQLTALSSIIDAISLAGGVRKTGSIRRIHVRRADTIFWFDAYDILYAGVATHDLTLQDGDRIIVPPLGPTAAIGGDVKRPGIFELAEGQRSITIQALQELAGGSLRPRGNQYMVLAFDAQGREQLVEYEDPNVSIKEGEVVIVSRRQDIQLGSVELLGHVRVPGRRSLSSVGTIAELVGEATAFKNDPYLPFAALETTDPETRARRLFPVNLQSILAGAQDYRLRDGDRLIVLSGSDVRYLSSADVQRIISRRLEADIRQAAASETGLPQERRAGTQQGQQGAQQQGAQQALGPGAIGSLQQLLTDFEGGSALAEQAAQLRDGQPLELIDPTLLALERCAGLRRLASIIASSSADRFTNAVRTIGEEEDLVQSGRVPCPPIFDEFGDLLPLALEHVIAVNGQVRAPGAYPVTGSTPVTSLIAVAGGLTREVDLTRVEISRFTPDSLQGSVDANRDMVNLAKLGADKVALGPGDVIRFNAVFTDRDTGPVLLVGEFLRPGLYEIRRGERLSETIARAGGLTAQAYPYGAVFTRERVRRAQQLGFQRAARELDAALAAAAVQRGVNATAVLALRSLSGELEAVEALGRVVIEADPTVLRVKPELDIVLEPGDRIFMPKRPNFVTVIGDVLNPSALQFIAGRTVDEYIRQAGGYQASADEDRVFVVYPNGAAEPVAVTVWNFNPIQVPPGSTIVVPKDPVPLDLFTLVREGSSLISQLAVTAASLAVIGRN